MRATHTNTNSKFESQFIGSLISNDRAPSKKLRNVKITLGVPNWNVMTYQLELRTLHWCNPNFSSSEKQHGKLELFGSSKFLLRIAKSSFEDNNEERIDKSSGNDFLLR